LGGAGERSAQPKRLPGPLGCVIWRSLARDVQSLTEREGSDGDGVTTITERVVVVGSWDDHDPREPLSGSGRGGAGSSPAAP
jgi:hypothetical protein